MKIVVSMLKALVLLLLIQSCKTSNTGDTSEVKDISVQTLAYKCESEWTCHDGSQSGRMTVMKDKKYTSPGDPIEKYCTSELEFKLAATKPCVNAKLVPGSLTFKEETYEKTIVSPGSGEGRQIQATIRQISSAINAGCNGDECDVLVARLHQGADELERFTNSLISEQKEYSDTIMEVLRDFIKKDICKTRRVGNLNCEQTAAVLNKIKSPASWMAARPRDMICGDLKCTP